MRELGYVDGQNVILDGRCAAGDDSLISGFVADLVRRPVNIIVTTGTREVIAAKRATSSIPIVTFAHPDPIGMGMAESLARPGGNVTGFTTMDVELYGKRIEMLKQAVPALNRAGVLVSSRQPFYKVGSPWAHNFETAAQLPDGAVSQPEPARRQRDRLAQFAGTEVSWSFYGARPPRQEREASTMRDVTFAVKVARFFLRGLQ